MQTTQQRTRTGQELFAHVESSMWMAARHENGCFCLTTVDALHREAVQGPGAPMLEAKHRDALIVLLNQARANCAAALYREGPAEVVDVGFRAAEDLVNYLRQEPAKRESPFTPEMQDTICRLRMLHNLAFSASLRFEINKRAAKREAARQAEQKRRDRPALPPGHLAEIVPFPGPGLFG